MRLRLGWGFAPLLALFTKYISNVMFDTINKESISQQNCFGLLSRVYNGKGRKDSLITKVSAGNILCRGLGLKVSIKLMLNYCCYKKQRN